MSYPNVEPPPAIDGEAVGELEGTGRWRLQQNSDETLVTYYWDVRTTGLVFNLLAPLAWPGPPPDAEPRKAEPSSPGVRCATRTTCPRPPPSGATASSWWRPTASPPSTSSSPWGSPTKASSSLSSPPSGSRPRPPSSPTTSCAWP